jgi:hypothetical protein
MHQAASVSLSLSAKDRPDGLRFFSGTQANLLDPCLIGRSRSDREVETFQLEGPVADFEARIE